MAKHVYPPWHSRVQKGVFVVAVILCITLPVVYGEHEGISSTAVIAVLLLYFGLWAAFSVSYTFGNERTTPGLFETVVRTGITLSFFFVFFSSSDNSSSKIAK
jgi:hypothetical protein